VLGGTGRGNILAVWKAQKQIELVHVMYAGQIFKGTSTESLPPLAGAYEQLWSVIRIQA